MNLKIFPLIFLAFNVHANVEHEFLADYFDYKHVSIIAGMSCNDIKDDFSLLNWFSKKDIVSILYKLTNNTNINSVLHVNYWKIGVFFDIRCYNLELVKSTFFEATEKRMFDELRCWLILCSNLTEILHVIDDRGFGISTDFVVAVALNNKNYQLYDIYNTFSDRGAFLNVTYLGNWNTEQGINIELTQPKISRRSNLHHFVLKAIFWKCAYKMDGMRLEDYFEDYDNATKDGQAKFSYHLLVHLSELYNFTLEAIEAREWAKGDPLGPVGRALENNSVDLTGSPLVMTIPRTYIIKYVHQDWPFRICFIFRNPQPKKMKIRELFKPLSDEIWYLLVLLFILIFGIMFILLQNEGINSTLIKVSNSHLLTVGALCQQGIEDSLKRISTRITFLFLMTFSVLVYNYYSASIVSARLSAAIYKINDSLVEFGKLHLQMSSEPMTYLEYILKKTDWDTSQFYKNYWIKLPESKQLMAPEIGMRLVKKGGFAYHTHPNIVYPIIERNYNNREICELMEVHLARPTFTAFAVTMNSSIVELVRVGMSKISETGLKFRQLTRWQYRKPHCRRDILSASSITIYEFAPHLLLLIFRMIIAISTYIIEIFIAHYSVHAKYKIIKRCRKYFSCERIIDDI